ncbi:MAG: DoxX family membrane protein [Betaproteobacteria bacterium]|jgi:putative oxidoreductase
MQDCTPHSPTLAARAAWNRLADRLGALANPDLLALASRAAMAAVFFLSGRTKVEAGSLLAISPGAVSLFEEEYRLPVLAPHVAAAVAAWAEHLFPLLLVLGLGTRLSAVALLGMTAVIQVFVYPDAWPTHLTWAVALLLLAGRGGGRMSLDHRLGIR